MFALIRSRYVLSCRSETFISAYTPLPPLYAHPKPFMKLYEPLSFNVGFYGSSNIRESKVYERGTFLVKNVV